MAISVTLPLSEEAALDLRAGDEIELTGTVLTGRDQACARLTKMIENGEPLPVDLSGQLLYFVGPTPAKPGELIGSAGPTTSGRMNPFMPALLAAGLRGFIGKGYLAQPVKDALIAHRGVYFGAIGGSGALLSACIMSVEVVAFPELLSEAMRIMRFERFPVVVLNDAHGGDLYAAALAC
jgi:fumarate hydratase subunit beta